MGNMDLSNVGRRLTHPKKTPRPKRSVRDDPNRFPGWDRLKALYEKAPTQEHKIIFASLFLTGARVSEAITIWRDQVAYNEDSLYFYGLPVLKKGKDNPATRNAMLPRTDQNVLIPPFIKYLESCETKYLLPARSRFVGEVVKDKHTSRFTVYRKLQAIDESLFPHLLRAWCAGYLVEEHGFNAFDLQPWFNWTSVDTPSWYASTREKALEEKLGITSPAKQKN